MKNSPYLQQLDIMTQVTRKAGEIAREFQAKGFKQLDMKEKGDPFLTEADIAIDTHLKTSLMKAFPDYGWYSEETKPTEECLTKEFCFVVDPIDGTRDFVERNGEFSISVGLIHNGKPVVGIVYAPMKDRFISGAKGTGVMLNGEVQPAIAEKNVAGSEVVVSRSETRAGLWAPFEDKLNIGVVGSAAHKIALVAIGMADANPSLKPKNLWDICAGQFLVEEAGGHFVQLNGEEIEYTDINYRLKNYVAGPSKAYNTELMQILNSK
ncbi:MAG: hypothetical protein CMF62_09895 [Magnetococcales bacterium]|nr:hypothetical protein [Magnetococcales bacterium]|tara:strand:+ start:313914 stop:314711 length:798 start_codon:yes stop_codon:yes gene_type:complete